MLLLYMYSCVLIPFHQYTFRSFATELSIFQLIDCAFFKSILFVASSPRQNSIGSLYTTSSMILFIMFFIIMFFIMF